jgi:hypothetical protein
MLYLTAYRCVFALFDVLLRVAVRPRYVVSENFGAQNQRIFGFSSDTSSNISRVLFRLVQLQFRSELRSLVFRYRSHPFASHLVYFRHLERKPNATKLHEVYLVDLDRTK